ncbi:hypothetical protein SNEBB_004739 [Seison nebaliae]|nr:hypothetical protein SNEBB_004739 [Seison nebaliae]
MFCVNCKTNFNDLNEQKSHYRSEWHRFNLKRRVAGKERISLEDYEEKEKEFNKQSLNERDESDRWKCKICNKFFKTSHSYENHTQSKKHLSNLIQINKPINEKEENDGVMLKLKKTISTNENDETGKDREMVNVKELEEKFDSINFNCFFCDEYVKVDSLKELNIHMSKNHKFDLPREESINEPNLFYQYLNFKIFELKECLRCSKKFRDIMGLRHHMTHKQHQSIQLDGNEDEYEMFYDEAVFEPNTIFRLDEFEHLKEIYNDSTSNLPHLSEDMLHVVLPNGKTIVHSSLARYYKQSFFNSDMKEDKNAPKQHSLTLPSHNNLGVKNGEISKRYQTISSLPSDVQARFWKKHPKDQRVHQMKVMLAMGKMGTKNNKITMKHFRQQVMF